MPNIITYMVNASAGEYVQYWVYNLGIILALHSITCEGNNDKDLIITS